MPDRNPCWQGYLTLENLDEVHERLKDLLSGWFTVVEQRVGAESSPRVRTSQRTCQVTLSRDLTGEVCGSIIVEDSSQVFIVETFYSDPNDVQKDSDPKRRVHLTFEYFGSEHVPTGDHAWWVAAVERHED